MVLCSAATLQALVINCERTLLGTLRVANVELRDSWSLWGGAWGGERAQAGCNGMESSLQRRHLLLSGGLCRLGISHNPRRFSRPHLKVGNLDTGPPEKREGGNRRPWPSPHPRPLLLPLALFLSLRLHAPASQPAGGSATKGRWSPASQAASLQPFSAGKGGREELCLPSQEAAPPACVPHLEKGWGKTRSPFWALAGERQAGRQALTAAGGWGARPSSSLPGRFVRSPDSQSARLLGPSLAEALSGRR